MKRNAYHILFALIVSFILASCGGGGSKPRGNTPPPPPVDTDLDWDQGNWNEENWQ